MISYKLKGSSRRWSPSTPFGGQKSVIGFLTYSYPSWFFSRYFGLTPNLNYNFFPFLSYIIQTGADLIGINCRFAPDEALQTISLMKHALDKEGLKPYLMMQPVCYHAPDGGSRGFIDLPEIPFGEL